MHRGGFFIELVDLFVRHQGVRRIQSESPPVSLEWVVDSNRVVKLLASMDHFSLKLAKHGFIEDLYPDLG